jgi:hypothetical protein
VARPERSTAVVRILGSTDCWRSVEPARLVAAYCWHSSVDIQELNCIEWIEYDHVSKHQDLNASHQIVCTLMFHEGPLSARKARRRTVRESLYSLQSPLSAHLPVHRLSMIFSLLCVVRTA